jgi:hypothetical protein
MKQLYVEEIEQEGIGKLDKDCYNTMPGSFIESPFT